MEKATSSQSRNEDLTPFSEEFGGLLAVVLALTAISAGVAVVIIPGIEHRLRAGLNLFALSVVLQIWMGVWRYRILNLDSPIPTTVETFRKGIFFLCVGFNPMFLLAVYKTVVHFFT